MSEAITLAASGTNSTLLDGVGIMLLAAFTIGFFVALVLLLWQPRLRPHFEEAARMPLDDDKPLHYWRIMSKSSNSSDRRT